MFLILHQLQRTFSTSEKILERLVKLPLNICKLLRKLLAHSRIQILDDLHQRLLRLDQVIMLRL